MSDEYNYESNSDVVSYNSKTGDVVIEMNNTKCKICGSDYINIVATMLLKVNDSYGAELVYVNNEAFIVDVKYPYRSQGNSHVILWCENGRHFLIKSIDGHKGMVYVDDNSLMNELTDFLNHCFNRQGDMEFDLIFNIKNIKTFFRNKRLYD